MRCLCAFALLFWVLGFATCSYESRLAAQSSAAEPSPSPVCSRSPGILTPSAFDLYVDSSDKGTQPDGSQGRPFHTITAALDEVTHERKPEGLLAKKADAWIKVQVGTGYPEKISINQPGIKLIGRTGDAPRPRITSKAAEIVSILKSDVLLQGFELTNGPDFITKCTSFKDGHCTSGSTAISIAPGSQNITISDNDINHVGMNYKVACGSDDAAALTCWGDSHAISAESNDALINNLFITNNTISDLHLGTSEGITINGNVKTIHILNNQIHDLDNIAIDILGKWLKCSSTAHNSNCQAEDGLVAQNTVSSVYASLCVADLHFNPGQRTDYHSMGAIYVDGGREVRIDGNLVFNSGTGIDVGSERGAVVDNVRVLNNVVYGNRAQGLKIGNGPETKTKVKDVTIANNTLVDNREDPRMDNHGTLYFGGAGPGLFQNIIIANNVFILTQQGDATNYSLTNVRIKKANLAEFDHNIFFSQKNTFVNAGDGTSFDFFQEKFGASNKQLEPAELENFFVDLTGRDYSLRPGSKGIDAGSLNWLNVICPDTACCFDRAGKSRVVGRIDVGAFEYQPVKP